MDQLLEKLAKSKAIMDATSNLKRGDVRQTNSPATMTPDFNIPQARYNIPQEFLSEQQVPNQPYLSELPRENTKPVGVPTVDAIQKSKLPDQIKKLMIEHPIGQSQQQQQVSISNELVERASRLMKRTDSNYVPESAKKQSAQVQSSSEIDYQLIQKMINEAVENAMKKTGMIIESQEKTNELFSFRVGKHLFEGKITKVKKLS